MAPHRCNRGQGTEARINTGQIHQQTTPGHENRQFSRCWKERRKRGKKSETKKEFLTEDILKQALHCRDTALPSILEKIKRQSAKYLKIAQMTSTAGMKRYEAWDRKSEPAAQMNSSDVQRTK